MEELADKLKAMLSDPEGVEKIMGIARALGEKNTPPKEEPKQETALAIAGEDNPLRAILSNPEWKRLFGTDCQNRNRLLNALCPFLSEEKREKLQRILKATSTLETVVSAGSLLG